MGSRTILAGLPIIQSQKDLIASLIVDFPSGRSYAPEDDGWIALIEEPDVDRVITEIWSDWQLAEVEWEGITYRDGFWQAIYLADNEKGFVIVIPDAPWIPAELSPPGQRSQSQPLSMCGIFR